MRHVVTAVRLFFGAWMLFNGMGYFFNFLPLPPLNATALEFSHLLEVSGLFDLAKIIEVVVGAFMLANRCVPLAIAMSLPVTAVIFFNNVVLVGGTLGYTSGPISLGLNLFLVAAYSQYFVPLLTVRSQAMGLRGLQTWRSEWLPSSEPGSRG